MLQSVSGLRDPLAGRQSLPRDRVVPDSPKRVASASLFVAAQTLVAKRCSCGYSWSGAVRWSPALSISAPIFFETFGAWPVVAP